MKQQFDAANAKPESTAPVEKRSKPFTLDELIAVWREFCSSISNTKPQLHSVINNATPTISGNEVKIIVASDFVAKSFIAEADALLAFLRDKLSNDLITIKPVVSAENIETVAYTPVQKLQKMIEKNPDIETLIKTLDLDLQ